MDTAIAWNKPRFIYSDKPNFRMIDNLPVAFHAFARFMLTLLQRYTSWSANFRSLPLSVSSFITHLLCFILHSRRDQCLPLLAPGYAKRFSLDRCICEECSVVCIVYICHSLCGISSASYLFQCEIIFFY